MIAKASKAIPQRKPRLVYNWGKGYWQVGKQVLDGMYSRNMLIKAYCHHNRLKSVLDLTRN